ncbi:MAG: GAF domain-containing protein [Bacteroidia bacterium]|nr:GAF domain-containing protein [Bacteroidia bacterium]MDW8332998.1 GAF domain-containing protein [Bacteroidia bacterium]
MRANFDDDAFSPNDEGAVPGRAKGFVGRLLEMWYARRNARILAAELAQSERETARLKLLLREIERRADFLAAQNERLSSELERLREKAQKADELERQVSELKRRQARVERRRLEEQRLAQFEYAVRQLIGKNPWELCDRVLEEFTRVLPVLYSVFYVRDASEIDAFVGMSSYGRRLGERTPVKFYVGEGVAGESVRSGKPVYMTLDKLPQMPSVPSALTRIPVKALVFLPIGEENRIFGLLEMGLERALHHEEIVFAEKSVKALDAIVENIATRVENVAVRTDYFVA